MSDTLATLRSAYPLDIHTSSVHAALRARPRPMSSLARLGFPLCYFLSFRLFSFLRGSSRLHRYLLIYLLRFKCQRARRRSQHRAVNDQPTVPPEPAAGGFAPPVDRGACTCRSSSRTDRRTGVLSAAWGGSTLSPFIPRLPNRLTDAKRNELLSPPPSRLLAIALTYIHALAPGGWTVRSP